MNKRTKGFLILLCAFAAVFILTVYFLIPKAASLTLPYRWGSIPLEQNREVVLQYLGRPQDTSIAYTDKWIARRDNGEYVLQINYSKDSIAANYKLYFDYKLSFFEKSICCRKNDKNDIPIFIPTQNISFYYPKLSSRQRNLRKGIGVNTFIKSALFRLPSK